MTPLQALERIIKNVNDYSDIDIEKELDTIAEALHVPTADEVCEAISKLPIYKDDKITYDEKTKRFMCNDFAITDEDDIPIFMLLGRFYEAQE